MGLVIRTFLLGIAVAIPIAVIEVLLYPAPSDTSPADLGSVKGITGGSKMADVDMKINETENGHKPILVRANRNLFKVVPVRLPADKWELN